MTSNLTRPSLGSRAISDLAPLSSPRPDSGKNDLGRGTHALQGGVRVVSGKPVALGGVAPFSPFLPLPPAPSNAEILRDHDDRRSSGTFDDQDFQLSSSDSQDNDENVADTYAMSSSMIEDIFQRRASSDNITNFVKALPLAMTAAKKRAHQGSKPAAFMIRSYSMPVATQTDYDAQQRIERARRSQHRAFHDSWSMSRTNSEASTDKADFSRKPLSVIDTNDVSTPLARSMSRQKSAFDSTSTPLTWDSSNVGGALFDNHSNASSSDETDVRTPRAVSPIENTAKQADHTSFFIHPDHMQKPSSWDIS